MGPKKIPVSVERAIRWLLAVSLIVFGGDHFIALNSIATRLIPTAFRGTCSGRYSSGSHLSLLIEYQPEGTRILGLSVPRPDVREMGRYTPLASGAETLELPELATSQSVVDPVHCNRTCRKRTRPRERGHVSSLA